MQITKHTGWDIRRETETMVMQDIDAESVVRDNAGEWFIRLVASVRGDPNDYTAYWITFNDKEARELKKALNYLLKFSKPGAQ